MSDGTEVVMVAGSLERRVTSKFSNEKVSGSHTWKTGCFIFLGRRFEGNRASNRAAEQPSDALQLDAEL